MFTLAFFIGIYSYLLFFLGSIGMFYSPFIAVFTILFLAFGIFYNRKIIKKTFVHISTLRNKTKLNLFGLGVVVLIPAALVNMVGVFGPEIGFDALWYHLTLPKLFLLYHAIIHFPGGLLYYSDMPKLGEMMYAGGLSLGSDILPHFLQYIAGILVTIAIYNLGKKFMPPFYALIASLIFYANLVVGWESVSAYIDLIRTFFEVLALVGIIQWIDSKRQKYLLISAAMMGLAISTKLIAAGSLAIFIVLIALELHAQKQSFMLTLQNIFLFVLITVAIPLPWLVFSYIHTGDFVYPLFTSYYPTNLSLNLLNPLALITSFWTLFIHSADPISPIYIIFLPLIIVGWKKFSGISRTILWYSIFALIVWYITPQTGGGRFILPYLPAFSLVAGAVIYNQQKNWQKYLIILVGVISFISIGYRGVANSKVIPYLFGQQSKAEYLSRHLVFSFGDFYDVDGYFAKNIKPTDRVLLYGFQNLYYVDFPFVDASWARSGDSFDYIATQNSELPEKYRSSKLIYINSTTHVALYSTGGEMWVY